MNEAERRNKADIHLNKIRDSGHSKFKLTKDIRDSRFHITKNRYNETVNVH